MDQFGAIFQTLATAAFIAVLVMFVWRFRLRDQARRADPGPHCPNCGYNLRATPNRCPECGIITFDRRQYLKSLRNDWPDSPINPREPAAGEEAILLVSTASGLESHWLEKQLRARGIANFVKSTEFAESLAEARTFDRVYVYADDVDPAREYLWRAQGIPAEMFEELRSRR